MITIQYFKTPMFKFFSLSSSVTNTGLPVGPYLLLHVAAVPDAAGWTQDPEDQAAAGMAALHSLDPVP